MPFIRKADAPTETPQTPDALGSYTATLFSDAGGLSQFGAFTEMLPPGSSSSYKHGHKNEDEFIYILAGLVTLHEGETSTLMHAGDAACFPASAEVGHCFENTSDADVTYLDVGTRSPQDVVTYPDHDRRLIFDRTTGDRVYETLDGQPAAPLRA